ncbi:MAG: stalk domain-containing protein [Bacillota bacterium]
MPPIIKNGRTLVPLRAIFEALGADVMFVGMAVHNQLRQPKLCFKEPIRKWNKIVKQRIPRCRRSGRALLRAASPAF